MPLLRVPYPEVREALKRSLSVDVGVDVLVNRDLSSVREAGLRVYMVTGSLGDILGVLPTDRGLHIVDNYNIV